MANDSSDAKPFDLRQDRRQWIITSATALGASLLSPAAIGAQNPQVKTEIEKPQTKPEKQPSQGKSAPAAPGHFFTPAEHALVDELSETILPADERSGGGKAAKVVDYIDWVLRTSVDGGERALWREGLHLVDVMARHYNGKSFVESSPEQRVAVLKVLSDNDQMTDLPEVRLFVELKRLTVEGYYTSKIGIHDELQYKGNRINQEFYGCGDQPPESS